MRGFAALRQLEQPPIPSLNGEIGSHPTDSGFFDTRALADIAQRRLYGSVRGFEVKRSETHLILQGRTNSYYIKQLAQSIVLEHVDEVPIRNEIRVY